MIPARLPTPVLPGFVPVPRQPRRNGWTPERQRGFIAHLAATGNVTASADAVGLSVMGAYHLRAAQGAASFRRAWDAALDAGVAALRSVAFDRAINGTPVTHFYHGKPCAETVHFDNRLLTTVLREYDRGTGSGSREGDELAEQVAPTDVAERLWHHALRESQPHKMRVFVARIRMQVANHFLKNLRGHPHRLDEVVGGFEHSLRQTLESRTINEGYAEGGPEASRRNARGCDGPVNWAPLDARTFARAQEIRTRLRREAGEE